MSIQSERKITDSIVFPDAFQGLLRLDGARLYDISIHFHRPRCFRVELSLKGSGDPIVSLDFSLDENGDPVEVANKSEDRHRPLMPGDSLHIFHHVTISGVKDAGEANLWPINLECAGERYKLQMTRKGKLLLTK